MRKIRFCCSIGYSSAIHEDIFVFDDTWSEEEIENELQNWAEQFLETWFEEVDDDDDE